MVNIAIHILRTAIVAVHLPPAFGLNRGHGAVAMPASDDAVQSGIRRATLRPVPAGIARPDEFLNKVPGLTGFWNQAGTSNWQHEGFFVQSLHQSVEKCYGVVLAGFLFLGEWYPSIKKAHKLKSPKPML